MKNIDWGARLKNKAFWIAMVPAVFLLIAQVAAIFGITLDLSTLEGQVLAVVESIFAILVIVGVVVDPTTDGFSDGDKAVTGGDADEEYDKAA